MSESDRYIVPALQRGLQLMQQFTRDEPAHTSAALARKLDMPRASVFRMLYTDVACGQVDRITPAQGCAELAARLGLPFHLLGEVGHACPLEAAQRVNDLLFAIWIHYIH